MRVHVPSTGLYYSSGAMTDLSARVRIFVRPSARDHLTRFFAEYFRLLPVSDDATVLEWRFRNGASLSAEFTDEALEDEQASWGAWLEIVTRDARGIFERIRDAGLPVVIGPDQGWFCVQAPGGQVIRLVSPDDL